MVGHNWHLVNQLVYRENILEKVLKPWAESHFGNASWTFQQDSAPAHKAKATQKWCRTNFPNLISSEEWPPCSPDLNPLDFSIWSQLEERVNATALRSVDDLKRILLREWEEFRRSTCVLAYIPSSIISRGMQRKKAIFLSN